MYSGKLTKDWCRVSIGTLPVAPSCPVGKIANTRFVNECIINPSKFYLVIILHCLNVHAIVGWLTYTDVKKSFYNRQYNRGVGQLRQAGVQQLSIKLPCHVPRLDAFWRNFRRRQFPQLQTM